MLSDLINGPLGIEHLSPLAHSTIKLSSNSSMFPLAQGWKPEPGSPVSLENLESVQGIQMRVSGSRH